MTPIAVPSRKLWSWPFLRHLAEMLAAMIVGMLVLAPLWPLSAAMAARTDVAALVMATDMSIGMAVWMWHRGHTNAAIGEMTAAMYAPYLVLLIPWWAGLISGEVVLLGGHLLMLPAMVLAMLHRADEYLGHAPVTRTGPVAAVLRRWPTALALVATVDNLIDPRPLPVYSMMVLPLGYLLIGSVRRTLRPRRVLGWQLTALAGYAVLLLAALVATPQASQMLVGAGWIFHAGWDLWHHRRNLVVPRPFAEWCAVVDLIIGVSVILVAAA